MTTLVSGHQPRAAVIGGGTMGAGIAYTLAVASHEVWVVEPSLERVDQLTREIEAVAAAGVERGKLQTKDMQRIARDIHHVTRIADLPLGLDVIIETVPERQELKLEVLREAESRNPLLLGSNTSALSITELAVGLDRPEAFLGMHFFNPVWSLALVEVVRGKQTSADTVEAALAIVKAIGKQSAVVNDSPGFATSRLDVCLALEAIRMLEEGVAEAADIDRAAELAYRHPVGPLRLSDIVGLDVRLDIARGLTEKLGPRFTPPALLIAKVEAGELGKKTGKGFYDW
ncbi:3-hydroxyacyl-CoA dehydrogenase family protein [Cryobacterium suzukii]|uniref:3-hydroxyacyl-CoA dehydrogenase family protein n=1 Tax=Cryobacterium suzukii TaxID=1259198 RepID=A0A4R9AI96_9MICO|nr:3-hydroxyacyl-CoA dehydrogenase family protein [Cryobacterium suzukii]TFD62182.1 3-hydroxyacyl-CoA dehydrogenase family protein [Cryobacterium suzukii]